MYSREEIQPQMFYLTFCILPERYKMKYITHCYYFPGCNTCYSLKPSNQQQNGGNKAS